MKTQTLIHTSFARASFARAFSETRTLSSTINRTFSKTRAGIACALVFMLALCAACFTSLVSTPQVYADETPGTTKTVTATQKITATFSADGTITVPDTQVQNGLDYTITIDDVSIESQYSFISDWQCAGVEGKTLDPGKEMVVVWAAPSKVPTSFDGTSEVKVGTITYTYTYVIPNLTGKITIDGTPEVGQVLTAQVSDLPQDVKEENLAYTWYVVAEDGSLTPIEGANAKTYTVAAGYEGKKLTCVATDSTGYYTGELKADPVVIKSALSGSVSITQNNVAIIEAEATSELVASLSADVPADANPTYAWYVSVDGTVFTPIENATGATFTPDATYVGKYIQVRVSSANYTGVLISTNKVKITAAKVAFVVLAGDDTNGYDMYFCKRLEAEVPNAGDSFKVNDATTVTATYVYSKLDDASLPEGSVSHDFENTTYGWASDASVATTPWAEKCTMIKKATIVDEKIKPVSTAYWFSGDYNNGSDLTTVTGLSKLDTSQTTNMTEMFSECWNLENVSLEGFDTSAVTQMYGMFYDCYKITDESLSTVESFNTSNVVNMSAMFSSCGSLNEIELDLSDPNNKGYWNTSNVTDMSGMFAGCDQLTSVKFGSNFNTSKVEDFCYMFNNCRVLTELDISMFDVSNATSCYNYNSSMHRASGGLGSMFSQCEDLVTLTIGANWDTSKVQNFSDMFRACYDLTTIQGIDKWDTSSALYMGRVFASSSKVVANCSGWDVAKVTDYYQFASNAYNVVEPTWP